MQGDVLSPLKSINFVDIHIGKTVIITNNVYMYKNKVEIPPLLMQDARYVKMHIGKKHNKDKCSDCEVSME